jgi:hypothetical protein
MFDWCEGVLLRMVANRSAGNAIYISGASNATVEACTIQSCSHPGLAIGPPDR